LLYYCKECKKYYCRECYEAAIVEKNLPDALGHLQEENKEMMHDDEVGMHQDASMMNHQVGELSEGVLEEKEK
jgi:hypothetical protein